MNRLIALFAGLFLLIAQLPAQSFKAYQEAAEDAFAQEDYYSAMHYYGILLDVKEEDPVLLYQFAESARRFSAWTLADSAYQQLLTVAEPGSYPEASYTLATIKKHLGEYDRAEELFLEFANQNPGSPLAAKAEAQAESCQWAQKVIANENTQFIIQNVDSLNTPYSEYAAFPNKDGLYYTSFKDTWETDTYRPKRPLMKIMYSEEEAAGIPYNSINLDSLHTAYLTFNTKKDKIYYSICRYMNASDAQCQLYMRQVLEDGTFGSAAALPGTVNIPGVNVSQPNIGYDETTGYELLFFSSDRPGGKGGEDIWCSLISPDGKMGDPFNVSNINTEEDEGTPFYHNSTGTLYFSSKGWQGLGGFDIFSSFRYDGNWSDPEHLGYPINSSLDDVFYVIDEKEQQGYLASTRKGSVHFEKENEFCCYDIYEFQRNQFQLNIFTFNKRTQAELPGVELELYYLNESGLLKLIDTGTNPEGHDYVFYPDPRQTYLLKSRKTGFITEMDTIDLREITDLEYSHNAYLTPTTLDLVTEVFEKGNETPLLGTTLQLIENKQQVSIETQDTTNQFMNPIDRRKEYQLIVSKPGYHPDTLTLALDPLGKEALIIQRIYLQKKDIIEFPPLSLYFDNDQPNPKTYDTETTLTYGETYAKYYPRKDLFIEKYTEALVGRDSFLAEQRLKAFFDREIRDGYESLEVFTDRTLEYLEKGIGLEITISGYTSPRASTEYNDALSARRVSSLMNHFYEYKDGILIPYIESKKLRIANVPLGERKVPEEVRDQLKSEKDSIYSPIASNERRVEIVGITILGK